MHLNLKEELILRDTTVESKVPLLRKRGKSDRAYPLDDMQIGDSFFIAGEPKHTQRLVCQAIWYYNKKYPHIQLTVRQTIEHGIEGVRCWRLDDKPQLTEDTI